MVYIAAVPADRAGGYTWGQRGKAKSIVYTKGELENQMRAGLLPIAMLCALDTEPTVLELMRVLNERRFDLSEDMLLSRLHILEQQGLLLSMRKDEHNPQAIRYILTEEGRKFRIHLVDLIGHAVPPTAPIAAIDHPGNTDSGLTLEMARGEVERLRSDLLFTVSHELRTPLTLIRTSIGLLLDSDPDNAMRQRLLGNIKQSADRMHALVTDLLDLVRLRAGHTELQMRRIDLGKLARDTAGLMKPLLDTKDQVIEFGIPMPSPEVMGDYRRLERLLLNLLSNAHKFSPPGGTIRIGMAEDADRVTVSVSDTGPGITPKSQERLWEQFYTDRTSSSSHNIGAGLGLPIARGIVEAHGGCIWVDSQLGMGSTFYYTLPRKIPTGEDSDEADGG